jgi:hypothetical protein
MYYLLDDVKQAWRYRNAPRPAWTTDSLDYCAQNLKQVPSYGSDLRLHRAVSQHVLQGGYMLEFGVATGRSIRHWAKLFPTHDIYGFDGFEGIYEPWNGLPAGHFAQALPRVPDNVKLVVGRFDATLPKWTQQHAGFASLIHVDCDLYSATKDIFKHLKPYIRSGTIIVFDEYWNYPTWRDHEYRAWQEEKRDYDYIGYVHGGNYQPVAIRVK